MPDTPVPVGKLIAVGRTAAVHESLPGVVVKLYFDDWPADWAAHELAVGRLLADTPVPTPRALGEVSHNGRQGVVFERVDGPSLFDALGREPIDAEAVGRMLGRLHATVHQVEAGGGLPDVVARLRRDIGQARSLDAGEKRRLLGSLGSLPPGNRLCHMDFHPGQVLRSSSGPQIVDWLTACRGPAGADVAATLVLLQAAVPPEGSPLVDVPADVRRTLTRAYLDEYLEQRPDLSPSELTTWVAICAGARLVQEISGELDALHRLVATGSLAT